MVSPPFDISGYAAACVLIQLIFDRKMYKNTRQPLHIE